MSRTDKIQITGLIISAIVLLSCLMIGQKIKNQSVGVDLGEALDTGGISIDRTGLPDYQTLKRPSTINQERHR